MYRTVRTRLLTVVTALTLIFASAPRSVSAQDAAIPDYYTEPGVVPVRDQAVGDDGHEQIDPFSGQLHLSYVDVRIPGNGGLDLEIIRAYNNLQESVERKTEFGLGWKTHFGRILQTNPNQSVCSKLNDVSTDDNPVLELPDGSRQILYTANALPYSSFAWITQERWKAVCAASGIGLIATSPHGIVYEVTEPGASNSPGFLTKKIRDRYGNSINIAYVSGGSGGKFIDQITTSDGRSVKFNYADRDLATYRLESIEANGYKWTYEYLADSTISPRYFLSAVRRPDGSYWRYTYYPSSAAAGRLSLKTVTHPYGGVTTYAYQLVAFDPLQSGFKTTAVSSKAISGTALKSASWTYSYVPGTSSYTNDRTTVDGPLKRAVYEHFGYTAAAMGGNVDVWKVGSLLKKETTDKTTNVVIETESFSWDKQLISYENQTRGTRSGYSTESYAPLLTQKTITRETTSHGTAFSNFDEHGNARTVTETGPAGTRITDFEHLNHTGNWLLRVVKKQTIQGIGEISKTFYTNGDVQVETKYGVPTTYTYSGAGDVAYVKNARNATTSFLNYKRGIPQLVQGPESLSITRVVNNSGTIASIRDARGYTTSFTYDGLNRPKTVTYPNGKYAPLTVSWQTTSRVSTRIGANQTFQEVGNFDGFGRPIRIKRNGIVASISYDEYGRKTFESYPCVPSGLDCTVGKRHEYDALDRIKKIRNNDVSRSFAYKPNGLMEVTNERLNLFKFTYRAYANPADAWVAKIETPSSTTDINRNAVKQVTSVVQGALTRTYDYYPTRFLKSITDPETGTTFFTRDEVGNTKTRTINNASAYPSTTTYQYDLLDRQKESTHAAPAGPSSLDNPVPLPAQRSTFTYDANGNLKTATRGCRSVTYYYDEFNYPTTETHADPCVARSWSFTWSYDDLNHKSTLTYPSGIKISYRPDALGRPTTALPQVSSVSYWPSGLVRTLSFANGLTTRTTQTQRLQLDTLITTDPSGNQFVSLNYDYDNLDNPYARKDFVDSQHNVSLTYDNEDRIDTANGIWGAGDINFDTQGNLTYMRLGTWSTSPQYDPVSNLPSGVITNGTSFSYAHDLQGNIRLDGVRRYRFDTENRLANVYSLSGTLLFTQEADALGQLAKRTQSGSRMYVYTRSGELIGEYATSGPVKEYVYVGPTLVASMNANVATYKPRDPGNPYEFEPPTVEEIAAFENELANSSTLYEPPPPLPSGDSESAPELPVVVEELPLAHVGDPVEYVGLADDLTASIGQVPLAWQDPGADELEYAPPGGGGGSASTSPVSIYFVTDLLGSPVIGVNDSRGVKFREYYTPFGERERSSGNAYSAIWFSGKFQDQTSRQITMGSRQHDPLLGRFRSTDPVGVDPVQWRTFNRYAYGNNSPGKYVDPSGNIVETAIDVVSFGLSLRDFTANPTLANGAALLYDGIALALPIVPGGAGIVRNAAKGATKAISEAAEVSADAARQASNAASGTTGLVDDAARAAAGRDPNRIYSARELVRRANEPGPYHNFPESFNASVFRGNRQVISDDYVLYTQRGSINGVSGTFEIGVRPSASGRTEVILHRFFRPDGP